MDISHNTLLVIGHQKLYFIADETQTELWIDDEKRCELIPDVGCYPPRLNYIGEDYFYIHFCTRVYEYKFGSIRQFKENFELRAIWAIDEDKLLVATELGFAVRRIEDWSLIEEFLHDEVMVKYHYDGTKLYFTDFQGRELTFDIEMRFGR